MCDINTTYQESILSIFLDESFPNWYTGLYTEKEMQFNPLEILDNNFTVTFMKQDGTIKEMTGVLIEQSKYTKDQVHDYCITLLDKQQIPMITNKGWRSFTVSSVIEVEIK